MEIIDPLRKKSEDTGRWKDLMPCSCSWAGRINIVKVAMLLKAVLIKIPRPFFTEVAAREPVKLRILKAGVRKKE